MKKIQIKPENAWLKELDRRIREESQSDLPLKTESYEFWAKEYYNIDLDIDPFGIGIILEMSDKDATWFVLQWGGDVLDENAILLDPRKQTSV
jgi:hypothetical protein